MRIDNVNNFGRILIDPVILFAIFITFFFVSVLLEINRLGPKNNLFRRVFAKMTARYPML